jgi:hypothetical protein
MSCSDATVSKPKQLAEKPQATIQKSDEQPVVKPAEKAKATGQKSDEQPVVKPAEKAKATIQKSDEQPAVVAPADPNIVAEIGDFLITKPELEKRVMMELRPQDYDNFSEEAEPVDVKTALLKMIAEKAMVIEARTKDYLEEEMTHAAVKRFSERQLVNLLAQKHVQGKMTVTDAEIEQKMKADPKLDKIKAKQMLERAKGIEVLGLYYSQIYTKSGVKKLSENFPKLIEIHQRLLYRPKQPRKVGFIRTSQVRDELTPEEKNLALAEYKNGKVTVKDWLDTLCNIVPPRRPKGLNTPEAVEKLLESALRMPLMVSEAESFGLDKDKDLLKQVREYEDRILLGKARSEAQKETEEPTTEQMIAYFSEHKEAFGKSKNLRIHPIWCEDLKTAGKAKAELDSGKDFESVRQKYSLEKEGKPFTTSPSSEGLFWKDLWAGDPNDIVGPLKGFYRAGVKWRIIKILEKNAAEVKEYSSDMQQRIKSRMMSEQRKALLAKYSEEVLGKYPYQIYADRIKDIDVLDVP